MTRLMGMVLVGGFVAGAMLGQGLPGKNVLPPAFPPDIVPPEVLQGKDALMADPTHYSLEFENDQVRVLRLTLKPNEAVPLHDDKDALLVCIKECHLRLTRANGKSRDIHVDTGKSSWLYGDTRSERNMSTHPLEMLVIETKAKPTRP